MMTKIKNLADIAYFSANKAVDYMTKIRDFRVTGKLCNWWEFEHQSNHKQITEILNTVERIGE